MIQKKIFSFFSSLQIQIYKPDKVRLAQEVAERAGYDLVEAVEDHLVDVGGVAAPLAARLVGQPQQLLVLADELGDPLAGLGDLLVAAGDARLPALHLQQRRLLLAALEQRRVRPRAHDLLDLLQVGLGLLQPDLQVAHLVADVDDVLLDAWTLPLPSIIYINKSVFFFFSFFFLKQIFSFKISIYIYIMKIYIRSKINFN